MRVTYRSDKAIFQSILPKDSAFHVVIVEVSENPCEYTEREGKLEGLTGDLYHNLQQDICRYYDEAVALTVVTIENSAVTDLSILSRIRKVIRNINEGGEVDEASTGYLICSSEIGQLFHRKPFDFLNVMIPNKKDKFPNLGFNLPFNTESKWCMCVPTWVWGRVGASVKAEGAGINLLGFVLRGVYALRAGETEGSIANQMRAYHKGKFGKIRYVEDLPTFKKMLRAMREAEVLSMDTETTSLSRINSTVLSLQVLTANVHPEDGVDKNLVCWFLPILHEDTPWNKKDLRIVLKRLRSYFENEGEGQTHTYHFSKFDLHQLTSLLKLRNYKGDIYDTANGSFSLEENQKVLKLIKNISVWFGTY